MLIPAPTLTLFPVTDTHCHLDYMEPAEANKALEQAGDFRAILTIGTNPVRNRNSLRIAEANPKVWAAVGLHPTEANLLSPELEADLEALAQHPRVRAIGRPGWTSTGPPRPAWPSTRRWSSNTPWQSDSVCPSSSTSVAPRMTTRPKPS